MNSCQSCECGFNWNPANVEGLAPEEQAALAGYAKTHCRECALEIVLDKIGPPPTNQGTGGGQRVIRGTDSLS